MAVQQAARATFGRGEVAEAEVRWLDAAEHYKRAARHDPSYDTLAKAGMLLQRAGRFTEAIAQKEALVRLVRQEIETDDPRHGSALNNLALSYVTTGRYDEAGPLYREALQVTGRAQGKQHPDYAVRLNNLAGLLQATGRRAEAGPLLEQALQVVEAALGAEHPHTVAVRGNLEVFRAGE